ncbi:hypothetical protein GCM10010129_31470 [Streptomyces fumigatiscleroticus]|nr:hypothetical protein GCM10010129_31470 [Streptomyces fumigatiscleroticus]
MQALRETDPRHIGPYEVLGRLGAGGMGEVYLAASRTGPRLAVKVVRAEHAEDRTFRARFRQEVRAARTVGGAGTYTARVLDADTEGERPWMATEFVDGPNLRDAVLDHGALPEEAVRVLAAALGEALAAIHAKGMVHRDLKPSNILLAPDGPRVIDFGIVRALEATALTRTGAVVGSVGYVSPEQIRNGGRVGPASDVFSLGAVLAYAAAGREPFGEGQDAVILMRVITRDFDLSGVPKGIRPLIESCLREEPDERPTPAEVAAAAGHTARSLREAVGPGWFRAAPPGGALAGHGERWLPAPEAGERASRVEYVAPVTVVNVPDQPAPQAPPSRRGLVRALAGGAAVAAVGGAGGWLWLRERDGGGGARGGARPSASASATRKAAAGARVRWKYTDGVPAFGYQVPLGALSADGKVLYVPMQDGTLHAVGADGRRRWRLDFGDEETYLTCPVVTPRGIAVVVTDFAQQDTPVNHVALLSPEGDRLWSRQLTTGGTAARPVASGGRIVAGGLHADDSGLIREYDATGGTKWSAALQGGPYGDLALMGENVLVPSIDNHLYALDARGEVLWMTALPGDVQTPAVSSGMIAVTAGAESDLFGIRADGRRMWTRKGLGGYYVPATNLGDAAFVGVRETFLTAIDENGRTLWDHDLGRTADAPVLGDGMVYVVTESEVHAVTAAGERAWRFGLSRPGETMGAPVLYGDRRLYTLSTDGFAALDITP